MSLTFVGAYVSMYYRFMEDVMKAIPTDRLCYKEDHDLWCRFQNIYENLYNRTPDASYWTEADVHQFIDELYDVPRQAPKAARRAA